MNPIIYEQEVNDGLSSYFKNGLSLSLQTQLLTAKSANYNSKVENVSSVVGKLVEDDFTYEYPSILVTAGVWNLNDYVFDKFEVWKARYSIINKPSNLNHNPSEVVAHTTRAFVITDEPNATVIPSEVDGKPNVDIPDIYHILTVDSFYKYHIKAYKKITNEDFAEKIEDIYNKIVSGELSVSMECIFSNFDYALMDESNNQKIIKRTDKTAFLSKKLRIFGGEGSYQGYRIGLIPRDIMFTGKGITDNPANPASVIFGKDTLAFASQSYTKIEDIITSEKDLAYITNVNGENEMNLEQLQAKVAELETELASKKTELETAQNANKTSEAAIAKLNEDVSKANTSLSVANEALTKVTADLETSKKELETVKAELSTSNNSLIALKADKIKSERINSIKESLGLSREDSETQYNAIAALSDENFAAWLNNTKGVLDKSKTQEQNLSEQLAKAQKELEKVNVVAANTQVNETEITNPTLAVASTQKVVGVRDSIKAIFTK